MSPTQTIADSWSQTLSRICGVVRDVGDRARADRHREPGTASRNRADVDDSEEEDRPAASTRSQGTLDNHIACCSRRHQGRMIDRSNVGGNPVQSSDSGSGNGNGRGEGVDVGDDDFDHEDDQIPLVSDCGDPTDEADAPINLSPSHVRFGAGVRFPKADFHVGMEGRETDAPQLLTIGNAIVLVGIALVYTAYTATHASSLPSGWWERLLIIMLPLIVCVGLVVFIASRSIPSRARQADQQEPTRIDGASARAAVTALPGEAA